MNEEIEQGKLRRLEQKVDALTALVYLQTVLLAVLLASYVVPLVPILIAVALIVLALLVLFRRGLPRWGRRLGHFFGAVSAKPSKSPSKTG